MKRFFNTTGPCDPARHFMLPAEARLPELLTFVERQEYFVLHAARQTGKTTAMRAFAARLLTLGHVAVWATLEECQGLTATEEAEPIWLGAIERAARFLPDASKPPSRTPFLAAAPGERLGSWLQAWAQRLPNTPIVLLLDEADVVSGAALVSFLRQLRAGFTDRGPGRFPTSIALVGMRDLRDHLVQAKDGVSVNPGSPFNIKSASLTLRNFTRDEVESLYAQHTADYGQPFTQGAVDRAFYWSQGQPFLANALARHCVDTLVRDRDVPVEATHVDEAKEHLILSRTTHLDVLAHRLAEPRVARIVQAVLAGEQDILYDTDDFQYVVDLGLIRRGPDGAAAANPLYREVLALQLSYNMQENLTRPWWPWAWPDGRLDFPALVDAFRQWWRENADVLMERLPLYPEVVPHLAFMAFVQRVANGGGQVLREFAAGRQAVDLVIEYGAGRFVTELKRVRPRDSLDTVRERGVVQLSAYLDTLGAKVGWLLVFDPRPGRSWDDRLWSEERIVGGRVLHLCGA